MNHNGTYILIAYNAKKRVRQVGALGYVTFKKGWYAYVGSAMGKNGFNTRVGRHIKPHKKMRWHIDYLQLPVRHVWISDFGKAVECQWAKLLLKLSDDRIHGFGCSDCCCASHLLYFSSRERMAAAFETFRKTRRYVNKPYQMKRPPGCGSNKMPSMIQWVPQGTVRHK